MLFPHIYTVTISHIPNNIEAQPINIVNTFTSSTTTGNYTTINNNNNSLNEDVSIVAQLDPKQKGAIYMLSNVCKESVGEKGLGSQLMDAVITWANAKNKPIKLNVLLKNPNISLVISLYSKYGFVYQTLIDEMLIFLYTPNVPFVRRTPNEIYAEIITDPLIRPEIKLKIQIIIKRDLKNKASKGKKIRKSKRIIKSKRTRN